MAKRNVLGVLSINLEALTARLGKDLDGALNRVTRFTKTVDRRMSRAGRSLVRNFTLPLIGLGGLALRSAGNFEAAMNRVVAATGITGDNLALLSGQARELGETTQFSATQVADAIVFLGKAGFDTEQILDSLGATLTLAAAGGEEMGRTADNLTDILKQFRLETSEADRVANVLAATATSATVSLSQMSEALSFGGTAAAGFGLEIEEAAALLAAFGDAGDKGSRGGTRLINVLTKLADVSVRKELAKLGVQVVDTSGELLDMAAIIAQLEAVSLGAIDTFALFDKRAAVGILTLKNLGVEGFAKLVAQVTDTNEATRQAEQIMQGLFGDIKRLASAVEGLNIALGDAGLLGAAKIIVAQFTEWVRAFAGAELATKRNVIVIAALVGIIGPLTIAMALAVRGVGALAATFGLAAGSATALAKAIRAVLAAGVALAAFDLGSALEENNKTIAKIAAGVVSGGGAIVDFIDHIAQVIGGRDLQDALDELDADVALRALALQDRIRQINAGFDFTDIDTTFLEKFTREFAAMVEEVGRMTELADSAAGDVGKAAEAGVAGVQAILDRMRAALEDVGVDLDDLGGDLEDLAKTGEDVFGKRLLDAVEGWSRNATEAFLDFAFEAESSFIDLLRSLARALARFALQQAVVAPFFAELGTFPIFGGGGSTVGSAKGNVFGGGRLIPMAAGGVITRPSVFPLAGNNAALVAEAGSPEVAFAPLQRHGGRLGVGSTPANVTVNIVDQSGGGMDVEVESRQSSDGTTIDVIILDRVRQAFRGGKMDRVLESNFGIRRRGVNR